MRAFEGYPRRAETWHRGIFLLNIAPILGVADLYCRKRLQLAEKLHFQEEQAALDRKHCNQLQKTLAKFKFFLH